MYIVSACLAGVNCRYDGKNNEIKEISKLVKAGEAVAICPEQLAGLLTPRASAEIVIDENGNKKVITKHGEDVTVQFNEGAKKTLEIAKIVGAKCAILKSKSPSCGCKIIYDGTFSKKLIEGNGITSELLLKNGIKVFTEDNF